MHANVIKFRRPFTPALRLSLPWSARRLMYFVEAEYWASRIDVIWARSDLTAQDRAELAHSAKWIAIADSDTRLRRAGRPGELLQVVGRVEYGQRVVDAFEAVQRLEVSIGSLI